ncbi:sulfotransferase domain-containing protein [Salinibacter sp.]|uniref:sulfotransferase domain-containing protein n=1 Tax=Salinibacter sp. TaxID=2065818 RepID=UPI00325FC4AC
MCHDIPEPGIGCPSSRSDGNEGATVFNHNVRKRGLEWYLGYFEEDGEAEVQARGEISPNYAVMRRPEIQLTHDLFPHLKIILLVRHPVERMWSALRRHWTYSYLDDVAEIGKDESSMLDYADQRLADAFGDYRTIYENWSSVFDDEKILLLRFDQIKTEPDRTVAQVLEFLGVDPDLDWIRSYREEASIRNRSKVEVDMPPFVRYYLSRRYLGRTKAFNAMTDGLVQDWVEDMEECIADGFLPSWELWYRARSAVRYHPVQWAHSLLDPIRTWWKVWRARQKLPIGAES